MFISQVSCFLLVLLALKVPLHCYISLTQQEH